MRFDKENIILDVTDENQEQVLHRIATKASELGYTNSAEAVTQDFLEREKEFSTGFGNGVAIPHAKSDDVKEATVFFVRLTKGVDWNSMDDSLVKDVIAIMVPIKASKEHLDTLAKLSRKIIHSDFIDQLNSGSKDKIYDLISETIN